MTTPEDFIPSQYADWFDRMLRSDNLDLSTLAASSTHIQDAFEDFVRNKLINERGFDATPEQVNALESVRRAFLDADILVEAGRTRGRVTTRFRNILTGRFTNIRRIFEEL